MSRVFKNFQRSERRTGWIVRQVRRRCDGGAARVGEGNAEAGVGGAEF